jgi:hypothetical protein
MVTHRMSPVGQVRPCREAAVTVGVPQIADDFVAMPKSAGPGHVWTSPPNVGPGGCSHRVAKVALALIAHIEM